MKNRIKLMSFNVLNGWKPGTPVYKTMPDRSRRAAEMVLRQLPDILCLQEFDYYYRHDGEFLSLIGKEYTEADTQSETPVKSWNPILFRSSEFSVSESGGFDFMANGFAPVATGNSDANAYPPKACNASPYVYPENSGEGKAGCTFSGFRSLSYAVLKTGDGKKLLVANTHYSLRPWCQTEEADFVTEKLNEIGKRHACSRLICGDFNSATHYGAAKRMLENGYFDTYDMASEKSDTHSCHPSSGKGVPEEADRMPGGTYKANAIDHVFADRSMTVGSYRILAEESLLSVSDHCPTIIEFLMEDQTK